MAKKSNKTAHVLNLLAGHDNTKEAAEENTPEEASPTGQAETDAGTTSAPASSADSTAASAASASGPAPAQNISVIDTTGEDPVAALIHEKLSSEFEPQKSEASANPAASLSDSDTVKADEIAEAVPEPAPRAEPKAEPVPAPQAELKAEPTPAPQAESKAEPIPVPQAESKAEPAPAPQAEPKTEQSSAPQAGPKAEPVPAPQAESKAEPISVPQAESKAEPISAPQTESKAEPAPQAEPKAELKEEPQAVPEPEPSFAAVNVMESIVKDKIIYFMRQFDVCTCDRCIADTVAMTLNGLTPKYIVTTPAAVDPLLSYYTSRLISDVTVEATKACMVIKDNPRH